MLKHCIRSPVIDLSPPPTLTVDDAVPRGLTPCQERGDGSEEVGQTRRWKGRNGKDKMERRGGRSDSERKRKRLVGKKVEELSKEGKEGIEERRKGLRNENSK